MCAVHNSGGIVFTGTFVITCMSYSHISCFNPSSGADVHYLSLGNRGPAGGTCPENKSTKIDVGAKNHHTKTA